MRQILVLTSIYPGDDVPNNFTPVVHYFTREWIRMGYDVLVINYVTSFPKLFYLCSRFFSSFLSSKLGFPVSTKELKEREYELENVPVFRISMKKRLPHHPFSGTQLKKAERKTIDYLAKKGFVPEVIVSHWYNPQVRIMSFLKGCFKVPSCYVCHSTNPAKYFDIDSARQQLNDCDLIGYRSTHIKKCVESRYGIFRPSFICYSGIPMCYITDYPQRTFGGLQSFIFVGNLIKRKYPSKIIEPLAKSFRNEFFEVRFVGTGEEMAEIKKMAKENDVFDRVHFLGRLPREEVIKQMDNSDVFIMISKGETYGLVYLEAMARGCITIASRNEGFDGIIKDGYNGYLCKAGDSDDLLRIINQIRSLSPEERQVISKNAYETAISMTDDKMAKAYLSHLEGIVEKSFSMNP